MAKMMCWVGWFPTKYNTPQKLDSSKSATFES